MWSNILDRISFLALFFVIVLLPIFFLPFTTISIDISKGLLLVVGLAISIIFWALARFSDGKIHFPKSTLLLSGFGIVVVFLLSALLSPSIGTSLFGNMLDIGTFWFILLAFILMAYSAMILGNRKNARMVLLGVIVSFAVTLVFQALRLFFPTHLAFGVLGGKLGNTLGSWNAFGVFAGFAALVSLFIVEFFLISKMGKVLLGLLMLLSLFLIASVNFLFIWELLGVFALIIFVYKISLLSPEDNNPENAGKERRPFPAFSFAIVMVSLLFFVSGQFIGASLPNKLNLSNNEISPSFSSTMTTTGAVLRNKPLLGIGPNMFGTAWSQYRPIGVNNTLFWNVPFNAGSGLLPTFAATTGYLGIFAWLIFFFLFIIAGMKSIFTDIKKVSNPEMLVFFTASLYLFIASFFYFTGTVMFLLALSFTGIFIGLSAGNREGGTKTIEFLNDHRKSFFFILAFVVVVIITAGLSFKYIERFTSIPYFEKAITAQTVPDAESNISKAISLYANDLYLRTYAQIYLIDLNNLAGKGTALSDAEKADLQSSFDQAVSSATLAINYNPKNYLNYESLASIYDVASSLGVKDAFDKATQAYTMAAALNPSDPSIKLALARLSFTNGKVDDAKTYANAALTLKPDYVDALVVLSQIAKSQGDNAGALAYAEKALAIVPTNTDLINYVNSLKSGSSTTPTTTSTTTKTTKKTP